MEQRALPRKLPLWSWVVHVGRSGRKSFEVEEDEGLFSSVGPSCLPSAHSRYFLNVKFFNK